METTILLEGLRFPEGPRWHGGRLWFSDMHRKQVIAVDMAGNAETIVEVENLPSGLGWTPDGDLLVVSMNDRRLLRYDGKRLSTVADLSGLVPYPCNDMVVDADGYAYIGNFGYDFHIGAAPAPADLIMVTPDGDARVAVRELMFPNGAVITPDAKTLIIAETQASRLTAFDILDDKTLGNRRIWAGIAGFYPDGIDLGANGEIWVATPGTSNIIQVREGGEITRDLPLSQQSYACAIGGPDRDTLLICTAVSSRPEDALRLRTGRIEMLRLQ